MGQSKKSKTNLMIIDNFTDLLLENDFRKITVQDIIDKSNISKTTFYKYFQDKYDLSKKMIEGFLLNFYEVIFIDPFNSAKYVSFINNNRFQYLALTKINDEFIDSNTIMKKAIIDEYKKIKSATDIEADYFSIQSIWALNYLSSLNRMITEIDLASLNMSMQNIVFRNKSSENK